MKKSKFTEARSRPLLRPTKLVKMSNRSVELKINRATFYNWKKKYSGMDAELLRQFKEVQRENAELKRMYADLSLDHSLLKKVIEKKL